MSNLCFAQMWTNMTNFIFRPHLSHLYPISNLFFHPVQVGFQVPTLDLDWSSWHRLGLLSSWYAPSRGDHASAFVTTDCHALYDLCLGKRDPILTLVSCLAIIQQVKLLLTSEEWFGISLRNAILWFPNFHLSTSSFPLWKCEQLFLQARLMRDERAQFWCDIFHSVSGKLQTLYSQSYCLCLLQPFLEVHELNRRFSIPYGSFRSRSAHWECFYPLGVRIIYDEEHFPKKWTSIV